MERFKLDKLVSVNWIAPSANSPMIMISCPWFCQRQEKKLSFLEDYNHSNLVVSFNHTLAVSYPGLLTGQYFVTIINVLKFVWYSITMSRNGSLNLITTLLAAMQEERSSDVVMFHLKLGSGSHWDPC